MSCHEPRSTNELSPVVDGLEAATLLQEANLYCLLDAVADHATVRSSDLPRLSAGYRAASVMMGFGTALRRGNVPVRSLFRGTVHVSAKRTNARSPSISSAL
jgi:hypothetical protein